MVMGHHVDTGNWTQDIWKSSQCWGISPACKSFGLEMLYWKSKQIFLGYMCVSLCVWRYTCTNVWRPGVSIWNLPQSFCPLGFLFYFGFGFVVFLRQNFLLNLELANSAWLAGQVSSCFYLPSAGVTGWCTVDAKINKIKSLGLYGKYFTGWITARILRQGLT